MSIKQSVVIQPVKKINLYTAKPMQSGDYSRKLEVICKDGSVNFITLIGNEHDLTIRPVEVTHIGKGKSV